MPYFILITCIHNSESSGPRISDSKTFMGSGIRLSHYFSVYYIGAALYSQMPFTLLLVGLTFAALLTHGDSDN